MGGALTTTLSSTPSLVVEFVGVPGVGKSTISHEIAAALKRAGVPCTEPTFDIDHGMTSRHRMMLKLRLGFLGAMRRPRQVTAWISAIIASGQRSMPEACAVTLNWCYLLELVRRASRSPGVHLFDQGLFQAWWSLQYGAQTGRPMSGALAQRLYPPIAASMLVVGLDASVPTALARLRGRAGQGSRVDRDMAGGRSAEPAMRASAIYDQLIDCVRGLETEPHLRLLRVINDGGASLHDITETVARDIADRYARMGGCATALPTSGPLRAAGAAVLRLV